MPTSTTCYRFQGKTYGTRVVRGKWAAALTAVLLTTAHLGAQQATPEDANRLVADRTVVGLQTFDGAEPLMIVGKARFVKGDGGKLKFRRPPHAPRAQIFYGFALDDITFDTATSNAYDSVFPEWWGAAGNDDPANAKVNVAAINAALAAVSNTLLAVSLEGTYVIDSKILPRSGSTLQGPGTVKAIPHLALPPHSYLIEVRGQTEVTIDGVGVDGNRLNQKQDAAHTFGGIFVVESARCIVKKCNVHDCNGPVTGGGCGNGIRTHKASDVLIADNTIASNNGCGINIYFSSKRIQAVRNTILNNTEIGIESEGRNGTNYADFRNTDILLFDNDISGHTESDRREDHGILIDWTDETTVLSNRCKISRSNGIEILGCREVVIVGNHCENFGGKRPTDPWAAVRVTAERYGKDGRSSNVSIFGNTLTQSLHGIYLDAVDNVVVGKNTITEILCTETLKVGPGVSNLRVLSE